jgi:O-acetylserine/cysteine efflux transporter
MTARTRGGPVGMPLPLAHLGIVAIVVLAWGSNFSAMKIALSEVPPFLFVALRFAILVPLILVFRQRPASWGVLIGIGILINGGQFALLFSGLNTGVSAGLASLFIQAQAPLTILLAALVYGERVTALQIAGIAVAVAGLGLFALSDGGNLTGLGLALVLSAALSWACGNLILRRLAGVPMLPLFIWSSLIPPLPLLALSLTFETTTPWTALAAVSAQGWAAVLYVAIVSTVIGYSLWGWLLARHRAAEVTPFALFIPVVGVATAAVVLGERLSALEMAGAAVILTGIALAVLGPRWQGRGDG